MDNINIRLINLDEFLNTIGKSDLNGNIVPEDNWNVLSSKTENTNVDSNAPSLDLLQDNKTNFAGVFGNPWRADNLLHYTSYAYILRYYADNYLDICLKDSTRNNYYSMTVWFNAFRPVFEYVDNDKSSNLYY